MVCPSRRSFITGITLFVAASPAIVRASSIMPVKKIISPWTDRLIIEAKANYVYIKPSVGMISTEEDWRQAKLYAANLKMPHAPPAAPTAPARRAALPFFPTPPSELPAEFEILAACRA
jgi:hypothetical protein